MTEPAVNLLGLPRRELEQLFVTIGEKPFRARQVMKWIYGRGVLDPMRMTDISAVLRQDLAARAPLQLPAITAVQESADGTVKWRLDAGAGQAIETVFIPEPGRGTLCLSSQVGCAMNCSFCATGHQGFNRNLDAAQIMAQVVLARRELGDPAGRSPITNVVFMGMGEPLANYAAVMQAVRTLMAPWGLHIGARRITISTVGLPRAIERLADENVPVTLAISLHAPNDELRRRLIPWAEYTTIADLMDAGRYYFQQTGREVTLEYILLGGVNDQPEHADQLASVAKTLRANVNLIRYNEVAGLPYARPGDAGVRKFQEVLRQRGVNAHIRASRGRDIAAACGQLRHEHRAAGAK